MIFFDTETEPFRPGLQFPPIVCGQFGKGGRVALVPSTDVVEIVRAGIASGETFCGHTIAFDFGGACVLDPTLLPEVWELYETGRVLDVGVRQKLLDISTGRRKTGRYSLDDLSRRYGQGALDKEEGGFRKRFGELRGVPINQWPERARRYAMRDVEVLPPIFKAQDASNVGGVLEDQWRQTAHAWWLKLASGWGITTDGPGVRSFEKAVRDEHKRVGDILRRIGWLRPDKVISRGPRQGVVKPGSRNTKPVKAAVDAATQHMAYDEKVRAGYVTDKGEPSTNKKALRELAERAFVRAEEADGRGTLYEDGSRLRELGEAFEAYADFSSLTKTISTDIPLLSLGMHPDRPIHTFFDSLKETGRIGSSKPNITNLPTKEGVRECFVPRPGMCFVSADYGGIELYTWAEACVVLVGMSSLAEELRAGIDPHLTVASDILGKPYDWCKIHKKLHEVYLARQTGKVLNFGCPGGLGAARLAFAAINQYGVHLTLARAKELRDYWWSKRYEMRPYSRYVSSITDVGGVIEQLYSGRIRGGCSYTEGCNTLFQGLASDIAKTAGLMVSKACYVDRSSPLFGCRIVNFVHDELILEVPIGRQHAAAKELTRLMNEAAAIWLRKLGVLPKIEADASMRWSKKVVALYDERGELIPWTRSIAVNDNTTDHYGWVNGREEFVRRDQAA